MQFFSALVEKVVIVQGEGPDYIYLQTLLPSTMPNATDQGLFLKFECAAGDGARYLKEVLGIEVDEVITHGKV